MKEQIKSMILLPSLYCIQKYILVGEHGTQHSIADDCILPYNQQAEYSINSFVLLLLIEANIKLLLYLVKCYNFKYLFAFSLHFIFFFCLKNVIIAIVPSIA